FPAEDGIRYDLVTGVQTCALPISSALARRLHANGHIGFCCATPREVGVMAAVGLGDDLLLANQVLGQGAARLGALAQRDAARVRSEEPRVGEESRSGG